MSRTTLISSLLIAATGLVQAANNSYFDHDHKVNLRFGSDNRFKIMQLTDTHFGESLEADERTIDEIKDMIRKEEPDFVAVTGDIVSGFMWN